MQDWIGNSKSVYKIIGASNHAVDAIRDNYDYYATEPKAVDVLLNDGNISLHKNVWECACGGGSLSERLIQYGYSVKSTDLIYRGYGVGGVDFLKCKEQWIGDIVTNPPYKYSSQFVKHALELVLNGNKVVMFMKLTFLEGKARKQLFLNYPPRYVLVSSSRLLCAKNGDFDSIYAKNGSAVAYAWFVWVKGYNGETVIKWVN